MLVPPPPSWWRGPPDEAHRQLHWIRLNRPGRNKTAVALELKRLDPTLSLSLARRAIDMSERAAVYIAGGLSIARAKYTASRLSWLGASVEVIASNERAA